MPRQSCRNVGARFSGKAAVPPRLKAEDQRRVTPRATPWRPRPAPQLHTLPIARNKLNHVFLLRARHDSLMLWRLCRRLKESEIFTLAAHPPPMRLPEAKAMELADQEQVRSSMLFCWLIEINDGDARPGAKRWQEIEEKAIRLGNLRGTYAP